MVSDPGTEKRPSFFSLSDEAKLKSREESWRETERGYSRKLLAYTLEDLRFEENPTCSDHTFHLSAHTAQTTTLKMVQTPQYYCYHTPADVGPHSLPAK